MMRIIKIAVLMLLFVAPVKALTVSRDCSISWDYPVDQEIVIDGFYLHLSSVRLHIDPDKRMLSCETAGVVPGLNELYLTAYNAAGQSGKSNVLNFVIVDTAPNSPENTRIIVSIP